MRLVLRGQKQYGLWEQSIDQTLDFDLDFAPVLQELLTFKASVFRSIMTDAYAFLSSTIKKTSCPVECKNCCKDSNFKCYR